MTITLNGRLCEAFDCNELLECFWLQLEWLKDSGLWLLLTLKWSSPQTWTLLGFPSLPEHCRNCDQAELRLKPSVVTYDSAADLWLYDKQYTMTWMACVSIVSFSFSCTDGFWCLETLSGAGFLIWMSLLLCCNAQTWFSIDLFLWPFHERWLDSVEWRSLRYSWIESMIMSEHIDFSFFFEMMVPSHLLLPSWWWCDSRLWSDWPSDLADKPGERLFDLLCCHGKVTDKNDQETNMKPYSERDFRELNCIRSWANDDYWGRCGAETFLCNASFDWNQWGTWGDCIWQIPSISWKRLRVVSPLSSEEFLGNWWKFPIHSVMIPSSS